MRIVDDPHRMSARTEGGSIPHIIMMEKNAATNAPRCTKQIGRRGDRTPAASSFGKRNPRRLRETRG